MEAQPSYANRKVTVMGLGLFGGGLAVTRYFVRQEARVTVTDLRTKEELQESIARLKGLPVRLVLGRHERGDFTDTDLVVVNPAVPKSSPFLKLARQRGVPLETETNLFFKLCPAPVIGVTGSEGKSTVAALIAKVLKKSHPRVWLGGNIGQPLLEEVHQIEDSDLVVMELSSFQLEDLAVLKKSPHLAVVTNIRPNHLDRHGSMEAYIAAKKQIANYQSAGDLLVLNLDDPVLRGWASESKAQTFFFSLKQKVKAGGYLEQGRLVINVRARQLQPAALSRPVLPGDHNLANILGALTAAAALDKLTPRGWQEAFEFAGLAHRMERVAVLEGISFYNDSAATTPASAIAALRSLPSPIILIAGGYDKKISLAELGREIALRTKVAILLGETREKLGQEILGAGLARAARVVMVEDVPRAVEEAHRLARPGDVVLLSPGCASTDMFRNFEERGKLFTQLVLDADKEGRG